MSGRGRDRVQNEYFDYHEALQPSFSFMMFECIFGNERNKKWKTFLKVS